MKSKPLLALMLSTILLSGCQTNPSMDNASPDDSASSTGQDFNLGKTVSQIGGGVVGAVAGSQIGKGTGKTLATIAGAIGGAYVGGILHDETQKPDTTNTSTAKKNTDDTPIYMKTDHRSAQDRQVKQASASNKYCGKKVNISQSVPLDVDVTYLRLKREFQYLTEREQLRANGVNPDDAVVKILDRGFVHSVQPGLAYRMKASVHLGTGYYQGWLDTQIEKTASNRSQVIMSFCEGGIQGFDPVYTKVIKNKLNKAVL